MDNWILCLNCGWKSCSNYNRIYLIKNALGNLSGDLSSSEPLELHGAGLVVLTDTSHGLKKIYCVFQKHHVPAGVRAFNVDTLIFRVRTEYFAVSGVWMR